MKKVFLLSLFTGLTLLSLVRWNVGSCLTGIHPEDTANERRCLLIPYYCWRKSNQTTECDGGKVQHNGSSIICLTEKLLARDRIIPETIFTRNLSLTNFEIHEIKDGAFQGLSFLRSMYLTGNVMPTIFSYTFLSKGLRRLRNLILGPNQIEAIQPNGFLGLTKLDTIFIRGNKIHCIKNNTFWGLRFLRFLSAIENEIKSIEPGAFNYLRNLQFLKLDKNRLTSIEPGTFIGLSQVNQLYLDNNKIETVRFGKSTEFTGRLKYLNLRNNSIRHLRTHMFIAFQKLRSLSLQYNEIRDVQMDSFVGLTKLQYLNLSYNSIKHLKGHSFSGIGALKLLDLSENEISEIKNDAFSGLRNLTYLVMNNTNVSILHLKTLSGLTSLKFLVTSDNRLCCILGKNASCVTTLPPDGLHTCRTILRNDLLRTAGWILGFSAIVGNTMVIMFRIRDITLRTTLVQNHFMISLAVADGLMGVYMIIVTSADAYFGNKYFLSAEQWRSSFPCSLAGFLGFLSSETSVLTLTFITVDRFLCIMFPFSRYQISRKLSLWLISLIWLVVFVTGLAVLLLRSYTSGLYGLTDVCIGLPFHVDTAQSITLNITVEDYPNFFASVDANYSSPAPHPAWWFSVSTFIGVNLLSFLIIAICYLVMFIQVWRSSEATRQASSRQRELKTAMRMAVIVFTDFCCWMPVIVMGILTQTNTITLRPSLYSWSVIFIVPINSALNPFIFTFMIYLDEIKRGRKTGSSVLDPALKTTNAVQHQPLEMRTRNNLRQEESGKAETQTTLTNV